MRTARHRRPRRRGTLGQGSDLTQNAPPRQTRYWCEAFAYSAENGYFYPLGTHTTTTPRLALRWLHHQPEQERALSLLRGGHPYTYAFHADGTHYRLSAHPVPDLPMP